MLLSDATRNNQAAVRTRCLSSLRRISESPPQYLAVLQLRNARLRLVPNALTTFNEVAVLLLGFLLVIRGNLTLGMLLAAQTIAFSLKGQIENVISFVQQLPSLEADVLRLEDVLEQPRDPLLGSGGGMDEFNTPSRLSGQIELNDLSFGFNASSQR